MQVLIGCLLPFIGTTGGACAVFCLRRPLRGQMQGVLLGLSSGVMVAASVWSLLLPALELGRGTFSWVPACAGTLLGVGGLLWLDGFVGRLQCVSGCGARQRLLLSLTVTLHNIPEGLAVGAAFAGVLRGEPMAAAMALSLGVALQNIPEGAIIALPLAGAGMRRGRAFLCGTLSGAVEPAAAAVTLLLSALVGRLLPYLLAFAAGAMLCVTAGELLPEAQAEGKNNAAVLAFGVGFCLMMTMDVALG